MEWQGVVGLGSYVKGWVVEVLAAGTPYPLPVERAEGGTRLVLACATLLRARKERQRKSQIVVLACTLAESGKVEWHLRCGDEPAAPAVPEAVIALADGLAGRVAPPVLAGMRRQVPVATTAAAESMPPVQHAIHVLTSVNKELGPRMETLVLRWMEACRFGPASVGEGSWLDRLAFRVPVLLEGDRGAGKTFDVRQFAAVGGYPYIEMAGHESLESFEMLGHLVPAAGGMVWKDGKLAQAFRLARTRKVVLCIDELLRIPQRQLSALLTALSPFDGEYRLSTGRIVEVVDGVGEEEVVHCPVENLAVFATTNVGAEYAVDEIDPALAERFIPLRRDTTRGMLKQVLRRELDLRGFDAALAGQLIDFFEKGRSLVQQGQLNRHPTTRTLTRAIQLAESPSDIVEMLKVQSLLWVDRTSDGRPVREQETLLVRLIDGVISVPEGGGWSASAMLPNDELSIIPVSGESH